jgi:hypothetical protein
MTDVIKQLNDKLREKRDRLKKFRDAIQANAEKLRAILAGRSSQTPTAVAAERPSALAAE